MQGTIPHALRGSLYRNGPGLFERDGYRKQHLLDGDGMIQSFDFSEGGVHYRNRFVRTEKFLEEEKAGEFLYPTWTTRAPGGVFSNIGGGIRSQAGVTTLVRQDQLLALDEGMPLYTLDPATLGTTGTLAFPEDVRLEGCKAHTKLDPRTGDWTLVGTEYGRVLTLRYLVLGEDGRVKAQGAFESPRMTYLHDFFVTEQHVVFLLHPVDFSPFAFLAGMESFTDSLTWAPAGGNQVMVVEKSAGAAPILFEASAAFMWHSLNAYEDGGDIVADFVGYDDPDHFIGDNPIFKSVMQGDAGNGKVPGTIRRYRIDLAKQRLAEETVDKGHHEFPILDPRFASQRHRTGFFATGATGNWTLDGIARLDMESGQRTEFRFGPKHFVGEPIFAPAGPAEGQGWLLAQVQSGETGLSFLAIFDAENLAGGPVARVMLKHHVPISFHGFWQAS